MMSLIVVIVISVLPCVFAVAEYNVATFQGLNHPWGIAVDTVGSMYVVDSYHGRIVKFSASGSQIGNQIGAFVSNTSLIGPNCITVSVTGDMFISDYGNQRIVQLRADGTQLAQFTTNDSAVFRPQGLVVDIFGNLLVNDYFGRRVVNFTFNGTEWTQVAVSFKPSTPFGQTLGLALDAHNNLYVTDSVARIFVFDMSGQQIGLFGPYSGAQFVTLCGIAVNTNDEIIALDYYSNRVLTIASDGALVRVFDTNLSSVRYLATDESNNILVPDIYNAQIIKFSSIGVVLSTILPASPISSPNDVAVDAAGNMYVADAAPARVIKLSADGTGLGVFNLNTKSLPVFFGVAIDGSNGDLYVSDINGNTINKLSGGGTQLLTINISKPISAQWGPTGMTVDPTGNLYVADTYLNNIFKLSPTGIIQSVVVNTSVVSLKTADDVALDSDGNVYIADGGDEQRSTVYTNGRVIKLSMNGTLLQTFAVTNPPPPNSPSPCAVAVDTSGNVFFADQNNNYIAQFAPNGTLLFLHQTTNPPLLNPSGLAVDADGNVYVADKGNGRVVKFVLQRPSTSNSADTSMSSAVIVGIAIGVSSVVVLVAFILVYFAICRKGFRRPKPSALEAVTDSSSVELGHEFVQQSDE